MQYIERYTESSDWVTLFLLGCVILYSIVRYAYPKRFQEFIMLPINNKYFLVHGKSDDVKHPFNILLFTGQVISVSLFIFLLIKTMNPLYEQSNPWLFTQIFSGYTIFILVKLSIEKIIGSLFNMETIINGYLYQKLSHRNLLAVLVFIGNLVFYYIVEPTSTYLLLFLGLILVLNCLSLFYSFKLIGNKILGNFFYFILYLCALEISPYIILFKVFK